MSSPEFTRLWSALLTLTSAVSDLQSQIYTPEIKDRGDRLSDSSDRLQTSIKITGKVDQILRLFEEHQNDGGGLHDRVSELERHRAEREADSKRPVHVTIRRSKEKQDEKV
jgi:hypothetical protein